MSQNQCGAKQTYQSAGTTIRILGIGTPLVDLLAMVPDEFVQKIQFAKGERRMISGARQEELLAELKHMDIPLHRAPGGSAGNTIFALAKFGIASALLGVVGNDENGAFYRAATREAGVSEHALIEDDSDSTGCCLCLVTEDAERTMPVALAVSQHFDPKQANEALFQGVEWVHCEGYLLAHNPSSLRNMLEKIRAAHCRISWDLGSADVVKAYRETCLGVLQDFVDVVFANEQEAEALWGKIPAEEQARRFAELCPDGAVVKLGKAGCVIASAQLDPVAIPAESVAALDTTAAGDSFAAGYLYGLAQGWSPCDCAWIATRTAAEAVQVVGSAIPLEGWNRIFAALQNRKQNYNSNSK